MVIGVTVGSLSSKHSGNSLPIFGINKAFLPRVAQLKFQPVILAMSVCLNVFSWFQVTFFFLLGTRCGLTPAQRFSGVWIFVQLKLSMGKMAETTSLR